MTDRFRIVPTMDSGSTFTFEELRAGRLGVSPIYGSFLAEAAAHCLKANGHVNPSLLRLSGDVCSSGTLNWHPDIPDEKSTWADLQEAAEYGGYGVGIVVALPWTRTHRVERSAKGTGVDYWIGEVIKGSGVFQQAARLELSGILKGGDPSIKARLKQKLEQTKRSDSTRLPAYVVIVEFGGPEARLVKRKAEAGE